MFGRIMPGVLMFGNDLVVMFGTVLKYVVAFGAALFCRVLTY